MDFVFVLHSHLPWVLNHGRWPHGTDWLTEAAVDTYLPLLENLGRMEADRVEFPVTLGITPVLLNQLSSPVFARELDRYMAERLEACDRALESLPQTGDEALIPLARWWKEKLTRCRRTLEELDGDLVKGFRGFQDRGRLEIISSGATHGYLPLLGRDESIRLQLEVGRHEYARLMGRDPKGCWLPECAYRPGGRWDPMPGISDGRRRDGIERFLGETGFSFVFVDAHLVHGGQPLGVYGDAPLGMERFDMDRNVETEPFVDREPFRTPHLAYRISSSHPGASPVHAFARDPESSAQVWSRHQGFPGDPNYLEFHKIRWPEGLKLWRVTGEGVDLADKAPYDPSAARHRIQAHADHFHWLLNSIAEREGELEGAVTVAPFDTELFGHWWAEGVDFIEALYRRFGSDDGTRPVTASRHLEENPPRIGLELAEGSWGAKGNHSMWLNPGTAWTWRRLWPLEDRFWAAAPRALEGEENRELLGEAARQLLLAQSSDWQFMISTGAVPDYAEKRFQLHADDLSLLLEGLEGGEGSPQRERARARAAEVRERDDLFPDVLESVSVALR